MWLSFLKKYYKDYKILSPSLSLYFARAHDSNRRKSARDTGDAITSRPSSAFVEVRIAGDDTPTTVQNGISDSCRSTDSPDSVETRSTFTSTIAGWSRLADTTDRSSFGKSTE
eukprot:PhM_4_TR14846/c0_g1_i1/m.82880